MKILVTGSSGHLAQALLPKLCTHPDITQIIGVDINPNSSLAVKPFALSLSKGHSWFDNTRKEYAGVCPAAMRRPSRRLTTNGLAGGVSPNGLSGVNQPRFSHDKFEHRQIDVRDPTLDALLTGCDALIHLAFIVLRGKMDAATMHDINVTATQRLFDAAAGAGIKRLIHLSSAAVYGSGENLREDAPLKPLPGFLYAAHKVELENWFAQQHPQTVRLRPHIILGPHCLPLFRQLLALPLYVRLPELQPGLQCVHEDDVAAAIVLTLFSDARGAFNLAAPGTFSFKEVILQRHHVALPLPLSFAKKFLNLACRITGWGGEPTWLDGIQHSLTLDCKRAQEELKWEATVTPEDMRYLSWRSRKAN